MQVGATATAGLVQALRLTEMRAKNISRLNDPATRVDIVEEVVGVAGAKQAFKANLAVVKTADEMVGRLVDVKA